MSALKTPCVTLKLATSLDGKIALANGASRWITGPESREEVHRLRASHEAILTGIGTILADDPQMTARPEGGSETQPDVIVMDSKSRIPRDAKIFVEESRQVFARRDGNLTEGIRKYSTVLIEAGSQIVASAIKADLVDRIEWFRAPIVLGGDGLSVMSELDLEALDEAPKFKRVAMTERGDDIQESYERVR